MMKFLNKLLHRDKNVHVKFSRSFSEMLPSEYLTDTEMKILSGDTNRWVREDMRRFGGYTDDAIDAFFANRREILEKLSQHPVHYVRWKADKVIRDIKTYGEWV